MTWQEVDAASSPAGRCEIRGFSSLLAFRMLFGLGLLGACGSTPQAKDFEVADREQWDARSNLLLQPLCTDSRVGCTELLIEISPNYFKNIAQPAIDARFHVEQKSSKDGVDEFVWTNKIGGVGGAIEITLGATDELTEQGVVRGKGTTFTIVHRATLRVHTKGRMRARLDVTATGKPIVMSTGGKVRDLEAYELREGVLHAP